MTIWGNRDKEQPAEEPSADVEQESGPPDEAAVDNGEPAPAFWRAQGRRPAPAYGRDPSNERAPADTPGRGYGQLPAGTPEPAWSSAPAEAPGPAETTVPGGPASAAGPVPAERMAPGRPAAAEAVEPAGGPAAAEAVEPPEAPAPAVSESPAGTDAPVPVLAEEVVVIDAETAVKDPALTETTQDPAATEIAHEPAAAQVSPATTEPTSTPAAPARISARRWSEILATFVDDPRGSVKMAADAVDSAIEEIVTSVRVRQQALASSWQDSGADTEQLRTALREYRRFGAQVQQMSPAEPPGQGTPGAG
jgi:hypothetical protein